MQRKTAVAVIIGIIVVAVVGGAVVDIDIGEMQEFSDRAEAWCDAEGGELYQANAMGASGGTHCGDIGAHVHMHDVAATGWTHDLGAIQQHYEQRTGPLGVFNTQAYTVVLPATLAIGGVVLSIGLIQRRRRNPDGGDPA